MVWIIEEETDKYQFYYCLGFFNWKIKGDILQAREDFSIFINKCHSGQFEKEKELAQKWLMQIESAISKSSSSPTFAQRVLNEKAK